MTDQKNGPRADADNLLEEGGQREEKFSSRDEFYEIKVEGHLDEGWSEWLSGLAVTHDDEGNTVLTGIVPDQAALHGVVVKIRDLGLPILSLKRVKSHKA